MTPPTTQKPPVADDTMQGAAAIAAYLGKTKRSTEWLLEKGQLPAFKLGGCWHMRKSSYLALLDRLEADALAKVAA